MQTLLQDFRYTLRQLRNSPGFAFTAIMTLALGIGATIGVYTLVDAILLRPLPYRDPGGLFVLQPDNNLIVSYGNLAAVGERSRGELQFAALVDNWAGKMDFNGARSSVFVSETTANLPSFLGVQPALGRSFRPEENDPGRNQVLLLSDAVWRSAFHADPQVIGKTVSLRETQYTVIGVMPRGFAMPMDTADEVWMPAVISPANRTAMGNSEDALGAYTIFLRHAPGMTTTQMNAEVARIQGQISAEQKGQEIPRDLHPVPYFESLNHGVRKPLLLLLAVGASFWLLASLNVASLMIARAIAREREFAVRSALGASRGRLLRQSMVESILLSSMGSGLGLLLAVVTIKLLWRSIERSLPLTQRIHIEPRIVLVLLAITLLNGILVGLLPALRASGRNVQGGLRGGSAPLPRADQQRLRSALIAAQLTITVVLLAGAGLFLRTVISLRGVPLGFSAQNVLTGGVIVHPVRVEMKEIDKQPNITRQYYLPLLDKLSHLPGVQSVAMSSVLPMRSEFQVTVIGNLDGRKDDFGKYRADGRIASPGLPETFGIPMLRGRFFTEEDTAASPRVVVVNEAFADKYLKGLDPVGHTFGLGKGPLAAMRIVGVIGDVKQSSVTRPTTPEIYMCLAQINPGDGFYGIVTAFMQVGIRARIPAQLLRKQFETTLSQIDPDAQTIGVKTIHEAVEDSFGNQTLMAHLLEGFSGMALLIAMVGLYGTVAFSVAQRTREFGVRLALGAPQQSITQLILRRAMFPVIAGLIAGDVALWFATRLIRSYLFGVAPHDAVTLIAASLTLVVTAWIAALIPAHRAAEIDPMQALRTE